MKRSRIICCGMTQEVERRIGRTAAAAVQHDCPNTTTSSSAQQLHRHHSHRSVLLDASPRRNLTPRHENCGAHNKYDARPHSHQLTTGEPGGGSGVDISDLTVTLPGMVVGNGGGCPSSNSSPIHNHRSAATSAINDSLQHNTSTSFSSTSSSAPPLKQISKREKARQKLSNSLKRAKVLLTDRAAITSPSPGAIVTNHGNHANSALCVQNGNSTSSCGMPASPQPICPPNTCLAVERFKVLKLRAAIDRKPTSIDEKSTAVLKYRTPHFRAIAHVEVPCLRDNQGVQIGWIQACTEMSFINSYGNQGVTSWEFPEIVSGKYKMIGDADGKQYPWYGSKLELQSVHGPSTEPQTLSVHMNDNFFPQVTWYIPYPDFDKTPRLTHIHRRQKFYTFLVAKDLQSQRYHVLNTVEWWMELNVRVDPTQPLGKRATLHGPLEQSQPVVLAQNAPVQLEPYALAPPNANNAQTLIWRPAAGEPKLIVPPVESTMDMERYLQATRNYRGGGGGGTTSYSSGGGHIM